MVDIPDPENTSPVPDRATKVGLDFTGEHAGDRVLRINLGFFKYGTKDQTHGAALVFSLLLLLCIVGVLAFGSGANADKALSWLESAFLFVSGVAVGKSADGSGKGS